MVRLVQVLKPMKVVSTQAEIQARLVWLQTFHDTQALLYTRRVLIKPAEKKLSQGMHLSWVCGYICFRQRQFKCPTLQPSHAELASAWGIIWILTALSPGLSQWPGLTQASSNHSWPLNKWPIPKMLSVNEMLSSHEHTCQWATCPWWCHLRLEQSLKPHHTLPTLTASKDKNGHLLTFNKWCESQHSRSAMLCVVWLIHSTQRQKYIFCSKPCTLWLHNFR